MHGQSEESDDEDEDFAYGEFDASRVISNSTIPDGLIVWWVIFKVAKVIKRQVYETD